MKTSRSPEETIEIAARLAAQDPDCTAYYLEGDLGAGKTLFAKGIGSFYGVDPDDVTSPTFALVNRYSGGRRVLYHLDLYRIEDARELEELGIEEMEEEGALLVVEWAEKMGRFRRSDATEVRIEIAGERERTIRIGSAAAA